MHHDETATTLRSLISPVELGKSDQVMGTIFKKQIVSYGVWLNPDWWWDGELTMELDEAFADSLIKNFNDKIFGKRISVPLNHTGDVKANAGEVIKLEKGEGGLWAYLDIRRPEVVKDIENGLIFDVSIGFDWDYVDQGSMKHFGPTLIHVALVTDPYLNNMDDFAKADDAELSRRFEEYAGGVGFGKTQPSIIMMSKDKVEEMKLMSKKLKLAKVANDKEYAVDVTYKDAEGNEQTAKVEAGAEIEVPTEAEESVKTQIAESTAPAADDDTETDEEKAAREQKEADEKAAADKKAEEEAAANEGKVDETEKEELARLRVREAEFEADKAYQKLLAKGRITPAQKELFMAFATSGTGVTVGLSKDVKGKDGAVLFAKNPSTSVVTMLSAILEAGPKLVKFGEQGGKGEDAKVELTKEQEEKVVKMGFNLETFKKQLAKGTISLKELEEDK